MSTPADRIARPARKGRVMKDHEVAALVNRLRDIAVEYHAAQQLRERIAIEVRKNIDGIRQRIAALEAEKAEREAQEPVAWVLFDDIFIALKDMPDDPPNLECMKPLYARPLALREPTEDECSRITSEAGHRLHTEAARIAIGRAMFNAVREVMTK